MFLGIVFNNGLSTQNGCSRCPKGSFQDLQGQKSCKLCPVNGFSSEGATSEDKCLCKLTASLFLINHMVNSMIRL